MPGKDYRLLSVRPLKRQLGVFLQEQLKLELSKTKTLITHVRTEAAKFLDRRLQQVGKAFARASWP